MVIDTNPKKIDEILTRGVEDIFILDSLRKKLSSGQPLRIKFGADPTGPKIHIGRAVPLRKLKAFQDLGHQIVILVGDFTAQIGDPSDKLSKRPMLTKEDVEKNMADYKEIYSKILDISKVEFVYNSDWLGKLGFAEICQLAESFSVQQMLSRRNFKDRVDKGEEISLREFLYPLMQGYDSVVLKADVEIGGFDQLFNLKAGRTIQKHYGQPEQDILTCQMLEGTDGRKMSTSWGNVINITDEPNDMYGKVMSLNDELIAKYFLLCTDLPLDEIEGVKQELVNGGNPRDEKMRLAKEIVKMYHGEEAAEKAEEYFVTTFQKKEVSADTEELPTAIGTKLADLLLEKGLVKSKSDWRRLVDEGAVALDGEKITDPNFIVAAGGVLKVGKKKFVKLVA
ncbi:MAG: tyrosine--tRNA ligase [Candidatus Vogelbacteria bacterium]|nr:tyrosine--tRNA ligase [Candidatus Vogelbacteria bacterium]